VFDAPIRMARQFASRIPIDTVPEPFRLNDWLVDSSADCISRDGVIVKIEAKHMRVLLLLVKHAGEIVSVRQIEEQVWRHEIVTQNSIYQAIAQLRKALRDDRKAPKFIETVARKGYRIIAATVRVNSVSKESGRDTDSAGVAPAEEPNGPSESFAPSTESSLSAVAASVEAPWQHMFLSWRTLLLIIVVLLIVGFVTIFDADGSVGGCTRA